MRAIILILNRTQNVSILMDRGRDECFLSREELSKYAVENECASEAPEVEHVVDVFCAADMGLQTGIDLCCPIKISVLGLWTFGSFGVRGEWNGRPTFQEY